MLRACLDFRILLWNCPLLWPICWSGHPVTKCGKICHSPPQLPTVAGLPPAVCFHTLAHCILPVTLDGCPAAAAETVLPAPSTARWVVLSGPGPPSWPHLAACAELHLAEHTARVAWTGSATLTSREMGILTQDFLERVRCGTQQYKTIMVTTAHVF